VSGNTLVDKIWVDAKAADDAAAERWSEPPSRREAAK
jgi:hypothetical protein